MRKKIITATIASALSAPAFADTANVTVYGVANVSYYIVTCGMTNTMPLHVEILYNEYNFVAAFAVASLLALLALVTPAIKSLVEWQAKRSGEPLR